MRNKSVFGFLYLRMIVCTSFQHNQYFFLCLGVLGIIINYASNNDIIVLILINHD